MSQRRSYPNSGDFNLDDLFRPEPASGEHQVQTGPVMPTPPPAQSYAPPPPSGAPEYYGTGSQSPQGGSAGQPAPGAPWGEPPTGYATGSGAGEAPAPETQYLPPYPTGDPGVGAPAPSYDQQPPYGEPQSSYDQQSSYEQQQPSYGGQQSFGGQSFGGQQAFGQQPPYGRPQPPQQPSYGGQQSFGGQQPPVDETTRLGRLSEPGARSGQGRPSRKVIIGAVVAACAVGGILVGGLLGGGSSPAKSTHKAAAGGTPSATGTSSGSASSSALSPAAQTQAAALSKLLGTANSSRQAVIGAVAAIQKCDKLPDDQTALTQAAAQRRQLLASLAALKVDKLPTGQSLVDQLNQAWQASASADDAYAAWAGDLAASCDPSKPQDNAHKSAGDQASGTASTAKKQASTIWNAIATQGGLQSFGDTQL